MHQAEVQGATTEELQRLLGKGRARKGIFEGDLDEGELEIGQVASLIDQVLPVSEIINNLLSEYRAARIRLQNNSFYQFNNE